MCWGRATACTTGPPHGPWPVGRGPPSPDRAGIRRHRPGGRPHRTASNGITEWAVMPEIPAPGRASAVSVVSDPDGGRARGLLAEARRCRPWAGRLPLLSSWLRSRGAVAPDDDLHRCRNCAECDCGELEALVLSAVREADGPATAGWAQERLGRDLVALTTVERSDLERAAEAGERGAEGALKAVRRLTLRPPCRSARPVRDRSDRCPAHLPRWPAWPRGQRRRGTGRNQFGAGDGPFGPRAS